MRFFKQCARGARAAAFAAGEIVSTLVLVAFYFTFFALFAIPYRLFHARAVGDNTNFIPKNEDRRGREAFAHEY